MYLIKRN